MKSPFYFIIEPKKKRRYDNTVDWGGIEFIANTSKEDFKFSNREGEVVETPLGYDGPIQSGDSLLVHHNVFKYYNDMKGKERSGKSFLKDHTFFVDDTQFFAYKNSQDSSWKCIKDYCFIKPVASKEYYIDKNTSEEPLMGEVKYTNSQLLALGVKEGDKVCFEPESEYEFKVDGEKLYRMYTRNITMIL
jgi:hypothetical protein